MDHNSGLMRRVEPLITPEKLISRYLKGIPMVFPNGDQFTPDDLKDRINLSQNEAEILLNCTIPKEKFREKMQYDQSLYQHFCHLRTEHGPIVSIHSLKIRGSDGVTLFTVPPLWIETANFSKRLINVVPLLYGNDFYNGGVNGTNGIGAGIAMLAFWQTHGLNGKVPAFWEIEYEAGLTNDNGKIPVPVNDLIGTLAALQILSEIAPTNIYNSQSLSQDGISQSSSGPGPRIYQLRIEELEKHRDELIAKLKTMFASRYFVSTL